MNRRGFLNLLAVSPLGALLKLEPKKPTPPVYDWKTMGASIRMDATKLTELEKNVFRMWAKQERSLYSLSNEIPDSWPNS